MPEPIKIGQIVGAHGIKGQVKVDPYTEFEERFEKGARLLINDEWHVVTRVHWHKDRPHIELSGVKSREQAESLQWTFIHAHLPEPELEEDEYLVDDLIGLKVVSDEGKELGEVDEILAYPAQDILKVGELLIPMIKEFILEVDFEKEQILVHLLPGMLES